MWLLAADAPPVPQDSQTAIVLGIIALLTGVLVAVVGGVFSVLSARANRTEPSPPAPTPGMDLAFRDYVVGELAVARQREDDSDERDDMQDRALRHQGDQLDDHEQRLRVLEARDHDDPSGGAGDR